MQENLFYNYLKEIVKKYNIEYHGEGLGMAHGEYTDGKTQAPRTKEDLRNNLKPYKEKNLKYELKRLKGKNLSFKEWNKVMAYSIGEISVYEWECKKNNCEDNGLRFYLDELMKLKPENIGKYKGCLKFL